jgi:tRNA (Thr-GGU) A37 N-methylase
VINKAKVEQVILLIYYSSEKLDDTNTPTIPVRNRNEPELVGVFSGGTPFRLNPQRLRQVVG